MAPVTPSIQSFFQTRASSPISHSGDSYTPGDGFTENEIENAVHPQLSNSWKPSSTYEDYEIADLLPGLKAISFSGRIANVFDLGTIHRMPRGAKGCLKLLVKDSTGTVTVSGLSGVTDPAKANKLNRSGYGMRRYDTNCVWVSS